MTSVGSYDRTASSHRGINASTVNRCAAPDTCHLTPDTCARGMTLVEILAVVLILGLIAGTLLVGFSGTFGKAKHELAKSGIGVIVGKIELYRMEKQSWPGNDLGLAALSEGHAPPTSTFYLSGDQLLDPWNRPYLYVCPGPEGHPYEVISYGADGQIGGDAGTENADITSVNLGGRGGQQ
jgi:general secretion pathway protein G